MLLLSSGQECERRTCTACDSHEMLRYSRPRPPLSLKGQKYCFSANLKCFKDHPPSCLQSSKCSFLFCFSPSDNTNRDPHYTSARLENETTATRSGKAGEEKRRFLRRAAEWRRRARQTSGKTQEAPSIHIFPRIKVQPMKVMP